MKNIYGLPDNVLRFMPIGQQEIVSNTDDYKETIERLDKEIEEIPTKPQCPSAKEIKSKGSRFDCLIVYAHFFYAGCDWYILDWDRENDILFCYAILNHDVEMSELGSTLLSDLQDHGRIELDFYWNKCSLAAALYDKYPDYFPEPYKPNLSKAQHKKQNKQRQVVQLAPNWKQKVISKYGVKKKLKKNDRTTRRR